MAEHQLLGLFDAPEGIADAIGQMRRLGVPDSKLTVLSGIPYRPEMLGRGKARTGLTRATAIGVFLGVLTAGFLTAGIFLLYRLDQGGQPLIPIPPSLIVLFEVTMLGTMWATFAGLLISNRMPNFNREVYDKRITEGKIGLVAEIDEGQVDVAAGILRECGASEVRDVPSPRPTSLRAWVRFMGGAAAIVVVLIAVTVLFAYDIIRIPFPTNMAEQDSVGYEQGPRLAAPAAAVPVQGPVLIDGQPASEPVPSTADSLQRGAVLYGINCLMCHGPDGKGNGALSGFFTPHPADLTGPAEKALSDQQIFLVITQGVGPMPSLAENLSPAERWDVVNYVRSLERK